MNRTQGHGHPIEICKESDGGQARDQPTTQEGQGHPWRGRREVGAGLFPVGEREFTACKQHVEGRCVVRKQQEVLCT